MKLPVGAILMMVGTHPTTGTRLHAVRSLLMDETRPLTIQVAIDQYAIPTGEDEEQKAKAAAAAAEEVVEQVPTRDELLESGLVMKRYTFAAGSLGLSLENSTETASVVISEVAAGSQAEEQGVIAGGTLVALNSTELLGLNKTQVAKLLGRAPRPMELHVAVAPPPPPPVVGYTFGPGAHGLQLADTAVSTVIIEDVAKGSQAAAQGLMPGGTLVAINETPLAGMNKATVARLFGMTRRPLVLHVALSGDESAAPSSSDALVAAATTEEAAAEEEAESKEGFRAATAKEQIDHRRNLEEKRKVELEKRTSARVHAAAGEMSQAVLRAKATKAAKAAAKAELVEAQAKAAAAAAAARATDRLNMRRGVSGHTSRAAKSTRRASLSPGKGKASKEAQAQERVSGDGGAGGESAASAMQQQPETEMLSGADGAAAAVSGALNETADPLAPSWSSEAKDSAVAQHSK
jgi:hypothetical protein